MPSLLEQLNALLTDRDAATALAVPIGGSPDEAEAAIGPALARIIDGLAALAADERGAGLVRHLVDRHGGPSLDELDDHLEQAPTDVGNVILDRVFGAERGLVVIGLASALGMAPSLIGRLLPVLAPLVTAELSRRRAADDLDEGEMAELLRWDQRAIAQAGLLDGTTFDARRLSAARMQRQAGALNRDTPSRRGTTTIDLDLPGRSARGGSLAMLETAGDDATTSFVGEGGDATSAATLPVEDRQRSDGDEGGVDGWDEEPSEPSPEDPVDEADVDDTVVEDTVVEDTASEETVLDEAVTDDAVAEDDGLAEDAGTAEDAAATEPPVAADDPAEDQTGDVELLVVPTDGEPDEARVAALAWLGWAVGAVVLVLLLAWVLSTCGAATEDDQAVTVINVGGEGDSMATPANSATARATTPAAPAVSESNASPSTTVDPSASLTDEAADGLSGATGSVTEAELQGAVNAILRDSGVTGVVDGGRVSLTGTVDDAETRDWLEANVSVLLGVSAIDNQVLIGPASSTVTTASSTPASSTAPATTAPTDAAASSSASTSTSAPTATQASAEATTAGTLNELLSLDPVTFASGSPELTSAGRAVVDLVATHLLANPESVIEIGGHTDSDGDEAANLELSRERAEAVRTHLIEAGVAGDRLTATGYGEAEPAVPNDSLDNKAINRRIVFTIR